MQIFMNRTAKFQNIPNNIEGKKTDKPLSKWTLKYTFYHSINKI